MAGTYPYCVCACVSNYLLLTNKFSSLRCDCCRCPIIKGTKVIAQQWIRENPMYQPYESVAFEAYWYQLHSKDAHNDVRCLFGVDLSLTHLYLDG